MRIKSLVFVAIAVAGGLICGSLVTIYIRIPKEPRYQGRTLSAWLGDAQDPWWETGVRDDSRLAKWQEATNAVYQIGTNGIPCLLNWALAEDSKTKKTILSWVNSHPFLHLHLHSANEQCWKASTGLELLHEKASAAKPVLTQWSCDRDPERRIRGYLYLSRVGTGFENTGDLHEHLENDPDEFVRFYWIHLWINRFSRSDFELFPSYGPVKINLPFTNQSAPNK